MRKSILCALISFLCAGSIAQEVIKSADNASEVMGSEVTTLNIDSKLEQKDGQTGSELVALYNRENFVELLRRATELSEKNDPEALFFMGLIHLRGLAHVIPDKNKSLEYFRKSAESDYNNAQIILVELLLNHEDPKLQQEGVSWMERMLNSEATSVENKLYLKVLSARAYQRGVNNSKDHQIIIVPKDSERAEKTYQEVIDSIAKLDIENNAELKQILQNARFYLGDAYIFGKGIPADVDKGVALLKQNINEKEETAHGLSALVLAKLYEQGGLVEKNDDLAFDYYALGYPNMYLDAIYAVGMAQREGRKGVTQEVPKDLEGAFLNFKLAAESGHGDAMFRLAEMYYSGTGTPKNLVEAYIWTMIAEKINETDTKIADELLKIMPKSERQTTYDAALHRLSFFKKKE